MSRYLLYIDILGFSKLILAQERVEELYQVIASLNVHRHHAFQTIIFSDTIVVYNSVEPRTSHDEEYLVMYLCEFVQDLQLRLVGRNIAFRAVLTYGPFTHYHLNSIPCFYGEALVRSYKLEKDIQCTGLFIDAYCNLRNRIFATNHFSSDLRFVYLTRGLERTEYEKHGLGGGHFPIPDWILLETDLAWSLVPEVILLRDVFAMQSDPDPRVALKYIATWRFYQLRYPTLTRVLTDNDFDLHAISPTFDWNRMLSRIPEQIHEQTPTLP